MKIFKSIRLTGSGPICQNCAWFQNNPTVIEKTYPGLTAMSSGFASVRDKDGVCSLKQLYLSARDGCSSFIPAEKENNN